MNHRLILTVSLSLLLTSISGKLKAQKTDICPILTGETVPDVLIKSISGEEVSLKALVSKKPTIIIFYRGGWCPYCNKHLAELQEIETDILNLGYQIMAISPDEASKLNQTLDKNDLKYELYSDEGMKAAQAFGISFLASEKLNAILLEYSNNTNSGLLPVPSVFVVNKEGTILFEYINPIYKTRLTGKMLMAILNNL